ncbi:hypothetical protein FRX31_030813 [Thalictrum thalictroides]|uniref:Uncharacterized protein n=1 Tax=Thalictrum thalictroides TaxID=46969 RepID=A0A7J6V4F0_THATH|nr:hypothetical protein FRX31_030813 [Thalictrum thalictroides]
MQTTNLTVGNRKDTTLNEDPPKKLDTRSLNPSTTTAASVTAGQWFFAITGQNFDGHHFITRDLYSKGCVGVIGNKVCEDWEWGFVKLEDEQDCKNTLLAFEKMGIYAGIGLRDM